MNRKDLIIAVLLTFCITVALFGIIPTSGQGTWDYDPWYDINDDGEINMVDVAGVARKFGTSGTPIPKAHLEYDSDWIDISDWQGEYIHIVHNMSITDLNSENIIYDIVGKTIIEDDNLLTQLGLTHVSGWNKTYARSSDEAWSVVQTVDGGYVLAGRTDSGVNLLDIWLVKTDYTGNVEWNKTYGGTNIDRGLSVVQTVDRGYAIAGYTKSFGAGGEDLWLVKTDASGNMQWNQTYGGANDDMAFDLVLTADGGYILSGATSSFGVGYADFWLVSINASGNVEWNQTYGGIDDEHAWSVVQTVDGGYALAGSTYSFGTGGEDLWLVKTDASGNMQWNRTYGGTGRDEGTSLIQTVDGGYALAGSTYSFGPGGFDFWLVKTDASGNLEWNQTYGGSRNDYAWCLIQTVDMGYALTGHTRSFGSDDRDFWLVKTDASGNMQWNRTYGGTAHDEAYVLIQTSDGGYAMAGYTRSFNGGAWNFLLVKTDAFGDVTFGEFGLVWKDSTADEIILYRGTSDPYWNYVRVRIWKIKE